METEPELPPLVLQTMDPDSGQVIDLVECRAVGAGVECRPLPEADSPYRERAEKLAAGIPAHTEAFRTAGKPVDILAGIRADHGNSYPYLFARPNGSATGE